jgi:hypothetical protein
MVLPPYTECLKLIAIAQGNWGFFDGWCASQGINLFDLPFRRFLNLIYYKAVSSAANGGEEEVAKFEAWLESPIPGREPSARVVEDEMAQFMAATGAREASG